MGKREFTFRYKVRNWRAYSQALVRRGQPTVWFAERAMAAWRDTTRSNEPGRPKVYANAAIECALILKSVFHLSLRAIQGFLGSVQLRAGARHVVVEATGLKVYGAGEWHAGKYQHARRRTWRKLQVWLANLEQVHPAKSG